jgi:hypothetical protein
LGISLWELYNYIGKTTVSDQVEDATAATKRRLEYARSLFATQYANKQMVFDAGPVITLAITSLLYVLPRLKELSHASFFVPSAVYGELIDQPMTTRMHKLESFQVLPYFINDTLHVMRTRMLEDTTTQLLTLANSIYVVDGNPLTLVHTGEMHALALLVITQSRTFVVDERTTRMLLETPMHLRDHLQDKLHAKVEVNKENLTKFSDMTKHIRTIRSAELLVVGYELGMFEPEFLAIGAQDRMKREFLKGALWAIKLAGCTISEDEIKYLVKNAKHR